MTGPYAAQMNIEALIEQARGPEDADPFAEPMFLERFAALVRAQALDEAARVCVTTGDVAADMYGFDAECISTAEMCAAAIRAIAATKQQAQP
jgi:hypothetical protein